MSRFNTLEVAPPDAILGLTEAFLKDSNPEKINLSVGVYQNEAGETPVLATVKQAEERLLREEKTKSYLPISGSASYGRAVQQLILGPQHPVVQAGRVATVQTPGGTGALRVAADFLQSRFSGIRIWCSQPTWANHPSVFQAAGLKVETYPYLNASAHQLDLDPMLAALDQMAAGDVVLLHGCCHNPTGIDPTPEQWKQITDRVVQRKLVPLIDFAYQGFADGLEPDAAGLRTLCEAVDEALIASSYAKNFALYRERVGALLAIGQDAETTTAVLSHLKQCVRTNYSNPPAHGALIVDTILNDSGLRGQWEQEVCQMRDRINGTRRLFVQTMQKHAPDRDFSFIERQRGMFSFSGLTGEQVARLKKEYSIYIVGSGRINVAGITPSNIERLCQAIASVL